MVGGRHQPVLSAECLEWLIPSKKSGLMIDGTVGDGGHAEQFLDLYPSLSLIAVDVDEKMLSRARQNLGRFGDRVEFEHGWFTDVVARQNSLAQIVLLDLGIASYHYDSSRRGFSFNRDEPLDMRLSNNISRTAADFLNEEPETVLSDLFFHYGNERYARRIAQAVVEQRVKCPFRTSGEMEQVIWRCYPRKQRHGRIHPATRTFQALRIAVNDEIKRLEDGLTLALQQLDEGGRLGVIAFHSIDDRLVKHRLRQASISNDPCLELLTKRPLRPTLAEVQRNPRARSARLRIAARVN